MIAQWLTGHNKHSCIHKWYSFPNAFISCNSVASHFNFYVICTFDTGNQILANSLYVETSLVFQSCLFLKDVPLFDSLILSNTFLCNFPLVFWLVTNALMFPVIYLVLGLICFCIFRSSILVFCLNSAFWFLSN